MKKMYKCQLCPREFSERGIKKHIKNSHKDVMTFEQYYDKYLKRSDEGFCHNPNCKMDNGKPKKPELRGVAGYDKYCCEKCSQENNPMHDPEIAKKFRIN